MEYERQQEQIFCEERLKAAGQREASPTRDAWLEFKEAEKEHTRAEAAQNLKADYLAREENRKTAEAEEWKILKAHQRAEREAFFSDGKTEFTELRKAIFREVREEFRTDWKEFYQLQRTGADPGRARKNAHGNYRGPACRAGRAPR